MNQAKMTLKTFTEEYTRILDSYSSDKLREILVSMASEVPPGARSDFINKLSLKVTKNNQITLPTEPTEEILIEIDNLIDDVESQAEEGPDWELCGEYYDDEDSLSEFAEFIPPLYDIFNKVAYLFDCGQYNIAVKAYTKLFLIFDIEDDYGHRISVADLKELDFSEEFARYLRSLYLSSNQTEKVSCILDAMSGATNIDYSFRPKLQDMIEISAKPIPEFKVFLQQWINVTKNKSGPEYDTWYREAVFLLHGVSGIAEVAKSEGDRRPRIYLDWIRILLKEESYDVALEAINFALDRLSKNMPIRASIGDYKVICGQRMDDNMMQLDGLWVSFEAKPELSKLIRLFQQSDNEQRTKLMQRAVEIIQTYKNSQNKYSYDSQRWEKDDLELPSNTTLSLLMHAHLLAKQLEQAFKLAQKGSSLGWSSNDNPQALFVAYCLIQATGKSIDTLPSSLKDFFNYALNNSKDVWHYDTTHEHLLDELENVYKDVFAYSGLISNEIFAWCLNASKTRIEAIVSNKHRKAYDRAALLTEACTATLKYIDKTQAMSFFNNIKNKFPRHSAFQAELKKAMRHGE